jgi:hypothetical protein
MHLLRNTRFRFAIPLVGANPSNFWQARIRYTPEVCQGMGSHADQGIASVATSMRVLDSLPDGKSRFLAEVSLVKQVMDSAKAFERSLCEIPGKRRIGAAILRRPAHRHGQEHN